MSSRRICGGVFSQRCFTCLWNTKSCNTFFHFSIWSNTTFPILLSMSLYLKWTNKWVHFKCVYSSVLRVSMTPFPYILLWMTADTVDVKDATMSLEHCTKSHTKDNKSNWYIIKKISTVALIYRLILLTLTHLLNVILCPFMDIPVDACRNICLHFCHKNLPTQQCSH